MNHPSGAQRTDDESNSTSRSFKRKRTLHHPWQSRKLRIPDNDENIFDVSWSVFGDGDDIGSSCIPWHDCLTPLPNQNRPRPWPSSQVLSSTIGSNTESFVHKSPFLKAFYQSVGIPLPQANSVDDRNKDTTKDATATGENAGSSTTTLEDLDNPTLSTLTPTQHRRYLKLIQQTERRTPSERAHWKQLKSLVPVERKAYQEAVDNFWNHHKNDRLLLGLSSTSPLYSNLRAYCQWACQENLRHNDRILRADGSFRTTNSSNSYKTDEKRLPTKYGKCRQVLSLRETISSAAAAPTDFGSSHVLDINSLDIHVVDWMPNANDNNYNSNNRIPTLSELPSIGSRIAVPIKSCNVTLLQEDEKALKLVERFEADILVSDDCLEALLQIPGDATARWILPVTQMSSSGSGKTKRKQVLVLDAPLAQAYATPRACLTRGLQEGLCQQVCDSALTLSSTESEANLRPNNVQYAYACWTIPTSSSARSMQQGRQFSAGKRNLRVLIRSTVRQLLATANDKAVPVQCRVHVDYFPERGQELPSRYERSLWVLDQVLWQQNCDGEEDDDEGRPKLTTKVARVDGRNGQLLEWQDASIAHAFATLSTTDNLSCSTHDDHPMQGFLQLMQFFRAIATIDFADVGIDGHTPVGEDVPTYRLLCLPGRDGDQIAGMRHLADPFSVSVHAPCSTTSHPDQTKQESDAVVDLEILLQTADGVLLNAKSLQECQRPWRWDNPDRIPYTFPTSKNTTAASPSTDGRRFGATSNSRK